MLPAYDVYREQYYITSVYYSGSGVTDKLNQYKQQCDMDFVLSTCELYAKGINAACPTSNSDDKDDVQERFLGNWKYQARQDLRCCAEQTPEVQPHPILRTGLLPDHGQVSTAVVSCSDRIGRAEHQEAHQEGF